MHNLGSHPQPLPTKFATAAVETNPLTDAESRVTQFAVNFARLITNYVITSTQITSISQCIIRGSHPK